MSRFVEELHEARKVQKLLLIASLPRNDAALAQAALDGGADVAKIHINIHHHASNTHFGTLAEERKNLEAILKVWQGKPVGIVPFAAPENDPETYRELAVMGFDFYSLYFRHAVVGCFPPPGQMGRMLALAVDDPIDLADGLDHLPMDVCELSIMHGDTYGQPFTYHDLLRYAAVRARTHLPLVVPSQHVIPLAAVSELIQIGIEGLMIGTLSAGTTAESWLKSMKEFRQAIDRD
jgi:hypothetical protein